MYVHGLGDAQEAYAKEDEIKYAWLDSIKITCPKCKSTNCGYDDYEEEYIDYNDVIVTFDAYCEDCEHGFTFEHYG